MGVLNISDALKIKKHSENSAKRRTVASNSASVRAVLMCPQIPQDIIEKNGKLFFCKVMIINK